MRKESFDKACHDIFDANEDGEDYHYLARPEDVFCPRCGNNPLVYYCEDRLYLVKCSCCHMITLVKGASPRDAAQRAMAGRGVKHIIK